MVRLFLLYNLLIMEMPGAESLREHQEEVLEELQLLAAPHIERLGRPFELLDVDPENYDAQSLLKHKIDSEPADADTVEAIATAIEPRFPAIQEALRQNDQANDRLHIIGELLKSGNSVILATNHSDIRDIAFVLSAYYIELSRRGYEFSTGLVMSKILGFFGVEDMGPATDILGKLCNEQFYSFPRTPSIEQSKIAGAVTATYNRFVRAAMNSSLKDGNVLFAMAPSGTTDKPDESGILHLGKLSHGTMSLMQDKHRLVLPVAIDVPSDPNKSVVMRNLPPRSVRSDEEAHAVMGELATELNRAETGTSYVYDMPPDETDKRRWLGRRSIT